MTNQNCRNNSLNFIIEILGIMILREHQKRAIETSVKNNFSSGVHFHATGTGKSWVSLEIALRYQEINPNCVILWICEQKSILSEQFDKQTLKQKGYEKIYQNFIVYNYSMNKSKMWVTEVNSSKFWKKPKLIIINRAFLTSGKKYTKLLVPINLVIHDECHSIKNKTTQAFYEWLSTHGSSTLGSSTSSCTAIGFSATPTLAYKPFTTVLTQYSIYNAFCDDVIVPPKIIWWKKLNHKPVSSEEVPKIIKKLIEPLPYKKLVIWCGMIDYTYQLSNLWKEYFPDYLICFDTSENNELVSQFYKAKEKALLFCACKHREGSDIPNLDGCVFLDKVEERSPKVFVQCVGRVLRKDKLNLKTYGLVVDFQASSCMDIINRLHPFIEDKEDNNPLKKFPWKYSNYSDSNYMYYQLDMKKITAVNLCEAKVEEIIYTREDILNLFIRDLPDNDLVYTNRLEEELKLFEDKNLFPYLIKAVEVLNMTDFIPHVTRGSCGSSLLCYMLGISHVDPIKYNISFARFLNVHRTTLPDIDYDFPYHMRKDVFVRLEERYPGKVARISNHVHFHDKSALREAIRSIGYRKMIPKHELHKFISSLPQDQKVAVEKKAKELDGQFRTYSLHCGGIVFYPQGVPQDVVLSKEYSTILQQITYNKHEIAKNSFFKIDILSSRGIAILYELCGSTISFEEPILDEQVFEMLGKGDNIGVTLAESPLMRRTLLKVKPKTIEDLALCLAIIRPAAKDARGLELAEINDSVFIYDDDAIKFIAQALNCSEGDADKIRRGLTKGNKEVINNLKEKAPELISLLDNLNLYSFCKSHAFSYAQLVYQLAYYKFHRPKDFWTAVLKHSDSSYRKWVHRYHARLAGVMTTGQKDISIYAENRQKKISTISNPIDQLKTFGYWMMETDEFIPGCYVFEKDGQWMINGIIASSKIISHKKDGSIATLFLCYKSYQYIDLTIYNIKTISSKWVGCKAIASKIEKNGLTFYEAEKYYFY